MTSVKDLPLSKEPPWVVFPYIPRGSIGWRMGRGEDYYNEFYKWFSVLGSTERDRYVLGQPEPAEWKGFYAMIVSHPWNE
jgi:hypothetical protein